MQSPYVSVHFIKLSIYFCHWFASDNYAICLLATQGKHKLLKALFMVIQARLVSKKLKSILVNSIVANKNRGYIKDNNNLSSFGLNFSKSLYHLARSYSTSKFLILIKSLNALMNMALLLWPNQSCQIFNCLFLITKYMECFWLWIILVQDSCINFCNSAACMTLLGEIRSKMNRFWSLLICAITCFFYIKVIMLRLLT